MQSGKDLEKKNIHEFLAQLVRDHDSDSLMNVFLFELQFEHELCFKASNDLIRVYKDAKDDNSIKFLMAAFSKSLAKVIEHTCRISYDELLMQLITQAENLFDNSIDALQVTDNFYVGIQNLMDIMSDAMYCMARDGNTYILNKILPRYSSVTSIVAGAQNGGHLKKENCRGFINFIEDKALRGHLSEEAVYHDNSIFENATPFSKTLKLEFVTKYRLNYKLMIPLNLEARVWLMQGSQAEILPDIFYLVCEHLIGITSVQHTKSLMAALFRKIFDDKVNDLNSMSGKFFAFFQSKDYIENQISNAEVRLQNRISYLS